MATSSPSRSKRPARRRWSIVLWSGLNFPPRDLVQPNDDDQEIAMPHYIALIREESDGCYGVSFPDLPDVITGGDDYEDAVQQATEVLGFAAEEWTNADG